MSSSLVLTEAVIDDTDLYQNKVRDFDSWDQILSDQSMSDCHNYSEDEIVMTIDDRASEELELMKTFGLPMGFTSRSSESKPSKRKKKKKNKRESKSLTSEEEKENQLDILFREYWTQSGDKLVEDSWNQSAIGSQEAEETISSELLTRLWDQHWVDVYTKVYYQFVEDFNKQWTQNQFIIENNFEFLPKLLTNCKLREECIDSNEDNNTSEDQTQQKGDKSETKSSTSVPSLANFSSFSSVSNLLRNDGNDSDSDGPPQEIPTRVKRQHESDSVDLSEENREQIEAEVQTGDKAVKSPKKKKKKKSKYWHQRYRLFSLFDSGIKLDNESWYSVTPERIAQHIANRFAQKQYSVIIDAFCGAGGNTIQFALISPLIKVIAVDIDERKIGFARHNAKIYGVEDRIQFIVADFLQFAKSIALKADAVFLSPPWGGPKYLTEKNYTLDKMSPNGKEVFRVTNTYISPNIGFLLPRNIDNNELRQLAGEGNRVEVEQNRLNHKVKTVTAYFGDLISESKSSQ